MKRMSSAISIICLGSIFSSLQAAQVVIQNDSGSSYYQCRAVDGQDNQWVAKSEFELSATNKAFDACKKQSKIPKTCKAAKEYCEAVVNGVSNRPMWQCTALDMTAKPWRSSFYTKRDDAALGAKAFCQEQSGTPEGCYVNLLTCKNLNGM